MIITAPSGRKFHETNIRLVKKMAEVGFLRYDPAGFTLKSGVRSRVYVMGREDLTDNPDFEWEMGREILDAVWNHMQDRHPGLRPCLIGIPTAGTALAQAAAMISKEESKTEWVCHRIMREQPKDHGANVKSYVNGAADFARHYYMALDNVITDGKTKEEYAKLLDASGYRSREMPWIIAVDRQQGGIAFMQNAGFTTIVLYELLDLVYILRETKVWPTEAVADIEREIREHRLV